jgi:hypothetical protein
MVCDCCLKAADRLWIYRHYGFCIRRPSNLSKMVFDPGWWGFCVFCHALFIDRQINPLIARVVTLVPEAVLMDVEVVYRLLPEVIYDEVVLWEAGKPRYFAIPEAEVGP